MELLGFDGSSEIGCLGVDQRRRIAIYGDRVCYLSNFERHVNGIGLLCDDTETLYGFCFESLFFYRDGELARGQPIEVEDPAFTAGSRVLLPCLIVLQRYSCADHSFPLRVGDDSLDRSPILRVGSSRKENRNNSQKYTAKKMLGSFHYTPPPQKIHALKLPCTLY